MEKGVVKLVEYFNSIGLKTKMSCEGHDDPSKALFWISFSEKVTDEDIMAFKDTHSFLNGWFVKKYINNSWLEWRYIARDKHIAALDYEYFKSLERCDT